MLQQQQQLSFSNPLMPSVPGASPSSLIASQQITSMEGPLPGIGSLASNEMAYTQTQTGVSSGTPFKPVPKHVSVSSSDSTQHALPTSLEQLLERQWEQGSQFLMKQAEHFDIASLLSCLHQLKVENQRLEENIVTLAGRRDHLLAVNARLSLALGSQQSPHSPRVTHQTPGQHSAAPDASTESSPTSALSHLRSLTTTISPASQVSQAKSAQTQSQLGNSQVLSPTARTAGSAGTSGSPAAGFGSGSGVFTTVVNRQQGGSTSQAAPKGASSSAGTSGSEASPDRMGHFLMPRTPTPLLASAAANASGNSAASLAALTSQYSALSQDPQMMQLLALQQQAAFNAILQQQQQQPTSPHRTGGSTAAALAQSAAVAAAAHLSQSQAGGQKS